MIIHSWLWGSVETGLTLLDRFSNIKASLGTIVTHNHIHVFQALIEAGWDVNAQGSLPGTTLG